MQGFNRALVTGGAGFIGSHVVEGLLDDGLEVISVDDYTAGKPQNLDPCRDTGRLRDVRADVTDYDAMRKLMEGVDVVFHQAASKKTICLRDPRRDLDVNAKGAFNVLELARDFGVKKVVLASTGSVYGEARYFPQDEDHPLSPTSYYGVSKLAGERYGRVFCDLYDVDVSILRYFHVYGPRQEYSDVGGVVSIFGRNAFRNEPLTIFGDGTQQRSFTHVKDVVAANKLVATCPESRGGVYNCASGVCVTVGELARKVLDWFGKPDLPIQHADWLTGDIKVFDVDNSRIRALGLEFETNFDRGLDETLSWINNYLEQERSAA